MKALWITGGFPSDAVPAEMPFLETQARALVAQGCEVHVVAPRPRNPAILRLFRRWGGPVPDAEYTRGGVSVLRPSYRGYPKALIYGDIHRAIGRAIDRITLPDCGVIHAHGAYFPGLVAGQLARAKGVPYVLTVHGRDVNTYPGINRACHRRVCEALAGAARVIAVSEPLAERVRALAGVTAQVLPLGIDLGKFSAPPETGREAKRSLGLDPDKFVVLYAGRFTAEKGLRELVAALRLKDELQVLCVGDGPMLPDLVAAGFKCIGPVENAQMPRYYACADALVLPSYSEGLPTVLVEAGAMEVPVAATPVGGIPHLLGSDRGYYLELGSARSVADTIERMRTEPAESRRRAKLLSAHVLERYDCLRAARSLLEVYQSAVDDGAGRAEGRRA